MLDKILEGLTAFPHRSPTTQAEKKAAEYLQERLKELGLPAAGEPFTAATTFSWIYFILYFGFVVAIGVHYFFPLAGLLIAIIFTVLFVGEQLTYFSPLSRLVPRGKSQNVLARLEPESAERRLILVAHYDTSKTALAFAPGAAKYLRPIFLASLVMIVTTLFGLGFHFVSAHVRGSALDYMLVLPALYFLYAAALMLEREVRGQPVQGAADNASGVAVAVELFRRIQAAGGLPGWSVWLLLTGAEEVGMAGMSAFLNVHGPELDKTRTIFLNFDNLGTGNLTYITGEGMLKQLPADPELLRLAEQISKEEPFEDVRGRVYNILTLDTLVARARGYRALSFMGLNENGVPWPWHWHNDVLDNVDRELIQLAAEFAWTLIQRLAQTPQDIRK